MNPAPEQLKDPAWWDANAPECAEWFCSTDEEFHSDKNTCSDCVPRPHHTTWTGSGLPPVGVVCEALRPTGWTKCTIVNHVRSADILEAIYTYIDRDGDAMWYFSHLPSNFRPLKTHKDRVVEAAHKATGLIYEQLEPLYDAGMLVDPDDSQN